MQIIGQLKYNQMHQHNLEAQEQLQRARRRTINVLEVMLKEEDR
jgi:hypothetical protein